MGRLQEIENRLSSINDAIFQELGDSFLAIRNQNFSAFSRIGSQRGKQKTIKGQPDTILLLPDGKYMVVEYSTNLTKGLSKIQDDVIACFNESVTKISVSSIAEVVICVNFKIKTADLIKLKELCESKRVKFTIYTLDILSIELNLHHRDLVHQYLNLSLDTGQIVSIERFISEYNRAGKGIATHLDNKFLSREKEMEDVQSALNNHDFIILTGSPGVGKTKLCIEAINKFLSNNLSFNAYCISYKNCSLLEDLYQYVDKGKDYIIFVDDANRIDAFNQIVGFFKSFRTGNLKIILTVRDYAYSELGLICGEFKPCKIVVPKLSKDDIKSIIESEPFGISNRVYQDPILKIADGNPRLAIMASLLAKEKKSVNALTDVSTLFDSYFSTFVKDEGEFTNRMNLKTLGLVAFFYTIPYKNEDVLKELCDNFSISKYDFIDAVDKLEKLELVEIRYDYVKVSEQNLATYFFYRCFVKDNLLSFYTLLERYFGNNSSKFEDSVIPTNNIFGPRKVMDKLSPELKKFWQEIRKEKHQSFLYISTFYYYLIDEAKQFLFDEITSRHIHPNPDYIIEEKRNEGSYNSDPIIELLKKFFSFSEPTQFIELGFEYVKTNPNAFSNLITRIEGAFDFQNDDRYNSYQRQVDLFKLLSNKFEKPDVPYTLAFWEIAKKFLAYKYRGARSGGGNTIVVYEIELTNEIGILEYRKIIWECIDARFDLYPDEALSLLKIFEKVEFPEKSKDLFLPELERLKVIVEKHLNPTLFAHCIFVQNLIRHLKRKRINLDWTTNFKKRFSNNLYSTYEKLNWERTRGGEEIRHSNSQDYYHAKQNEIRQNFCFKTEKDIIAFYKDFVFLKESPENSRDLNKSLEIIIDETFKQNFSNGLYFFNLIINSENSIAYLPWLPFKNNLNEANQISNLKDLIFSSSFKNKSQWLLSYFENIQNEFIDESAALELLTTLKNIDESIAIPFERYEKYLDVYPTLFKEFLIVIRDVNNIGVVRLTIWDDVFDLYFNKLGADIELIEDVYIQQSNFQDHYDYNNKGFCNILAKNKSFLLKYAECVFLKDKYAWSREVKRMNFIWSVDKIENQLTAVFDKISNEKNYYISENELLFSLFANIENEEDGYKADTFLEGYINTNYKNIQRTQLVVDLAREVRRHMFERIVILYLSRTKSIDDFKEIWWRGNHRMYSGDVIIGDIEASEWTDLLYIIQKANFGYQIIPIENYIRDQIQSYTERGNRERERKFTERRW